MNITASDLLAALLWSAAGGLAVWFLLFPVRRRSFTGLLVSLVLTGAAASTGALLGAVHSMLIPELGWRTVVAVTAFSGVVAGVAAFAGSRMLAKEAQSLRRDVEELGAGRVPMADGRRLMAEIAQVRQELRTTAETLAASRERERALEAARRELVSWVSHDLRTPLAGLRAMAEALEDGVVDHPELYYKQIGASVDRLNHMVEDLFRLSRIQAGIVSRNPETVMLDDLASDVIAALKPLADAQHVLLLGSVAGPVAVDGDGPELNRAITNLVANAIRHTRDSGRVELHVTTATDVSSGMPTQVAVVLVRDECGGIPEAHLPRVFDVGFRGETARTQNTLNSGGAGLGLAITKGIVEAHAGTVDVQNTETGCQFRIRLPLATGRQPPDCRPYPRG